MILEILFTAGILAIVFSFGKICNAFIQKRNRAIKFLNKNKNISIYKKIKKDFF